MIAGELLPECPYQGSDLLVATRRIGYKMIILLKKHIKRVWANTHWNLASHQKEFKVVFMFSHCYQELNCTYWEAWLHQYRDDAVSRDVDITSYF